MNEAGASFLIGIGGGTAAGKTLVASLLIRRLAGCEVALLDQDSYYRDHSHLEIDERNRLNFDDPSELDHDLLFSHLERLRAGKSVEKPKYSFATYARTGEVTIVRPAPVIVLEGIFALWDERARRLMDLKIYVEAAADLLFIRRLERDLLERGRSVESVIAQYLDSVRPMHQAHIEPTRAFADFILANDVEQLTAAIDDTLAKRVNRGVLVPSISKPRVRTVAGSAWRTLPGNQ
jgi:uridine kinase